MPDIQVGQIIWKPLNAVFLFYDKSQGQSWSYLNLKAWNLPEICIMSSYKFNLLVCFPYIFNFIQGPNMVCLIKKNKYAKDV